MQNSYILPDASNGYIKVDVAELDAPISYMIGNDPRHLPTIKLPSVKPIPSFHKLGILCIQAQFDENFDSIEALREKGESICHLRRSI